MRHKYVLVGFILVILLSSIVFLMVRKNNKPSEIEVNFVELKEFEKKITLIEKEVVDLTAPNALLRINEFNDLVKQVSSNYNVVYSFVSDINKSDQQKIIAIYALRDLDFDRYLNFFEKSLQLYQKEQLSDNVIMTVLSPGSNWNCSIVQNYADKRVKQLLKRNLKSMSGEMKEVFKYTLSGDLWASIEDERNWSQTK